MKQDIRNFELDQLKEIVSSFNEPQFRAIQIFKWLYASGVENFSEMRNIPEKLRGLLASGYSVKLPEVVRRLESKDGTKKFLFKLCDGNCIESVLIPETKRNTVCVSTQVGCRFNCVFCASGKKGFVRNLQVSEILGQVLHIRFKENVRVSNIVFMGMGEPFDNYDNVIRSIRIINCKQGLNIAARKITVSTAGIVPAIVKFSDIGWQVRLSVSLHAPDDKIRSDLMPINHKYPLGELLDACFTYTEKTGRRITFEYILIDRVNCSESQVPEIAKIAKRLNAGINIIPFSRIDGTNLSSPSRETIHRFVDSLRNMQVKVTIRNSRGVDIKAACGQLAGKWR